MRLAIDVMGGDHAPDAILKGCLDALPSLEGEDRLVLVGPRGAIEECLSEAGASSERIEILDAPDAIEMDASPVEAVRTKRDSSIVKMALLGSRRAEAPVDAVLSAGNTGACVSAATMFMRRLPGCHRPGIAVTLPSLHGPVVLCDAGANPEPRPLHLAQYGVMAAVYASEILGVKEPRVAQVNISSEEAKGTDFVKQVRDLLRQTPGLNYIGYIEGRDLLEGTADVVVTDGFVGNTMLKLAEGMASSLMKAIAHEMIEHDPELAMRFEPVAKSLFRKNDYHEYGGAPLLGVNGVCFICHGSAKPRTITNAIRVVREYLQRDVNRAIVERLSGVAPQIDPGAVKNPASVRQSA
jgi:glycerol-3-phosphate acyltransferase PlsX